MNTANNQRRKASQKKLETACIQLLQEKEVHEISITEICTIAKLNRSTFYANYLDIYDLVEKIKDRMMHDFQELYADEITHTYNSNDYLKLFYHIKENQLFYNAYFKLNFDLEYEITNYDTVSAKKYYDNHHIEYHMEFFRGGISAIIKMWLSTNCALSPEEIFTVIQDEYKNKHK